MCWKTTFIKRLRTGDFKKSYVATKNVKVNTLPFYTSLGQIDFDIWDCSGNKSSETNTRYNGAHAAIIMFDVTSSDSYKSVPFWYNSVREVCPNIPIVLCGNKVDCKGRKVKRPDIKFHHTKKIRYYDISAKSNFNFYKPFLYLSRKLMDDSLDMVEGPAVLPPEVKVTDEQISEWLKSEPHYSD